MEGVGAEDGWSKGAGLEQGEGKLPRVLCAQNNTSSSPRMNECEKATHQWRSTQSDGVGRRCKIDSLGFPFLGLGNKVTLKQS